MHKPPKEGKTKSREGGGDPKPGKWREGGEPRETPGLELNFFVY